MRGLMGASQIGVLEFAECSWSTCCEEPSLSMGWLKRWIQRPLAICCWVQSPLWQSRLWWAQVPEPQVLPTVIYSDFSMSSLSSLCSLPLWSALFGSSLRFSFGSLAPSPRWSPHPWLSLLTALGASGGFSLFSWMTEMLLSVDCSLWSFVCFNQKVYLNGKCFIISETPPDFHPLCTVDTFSSLDFRPSSLCWDDEIKTHGIHCVIKFHHCFLTE